MEATRFWRNRYIRMVWMILVIVTVASFYIYQRVWVRRLVGEIELLQEENGQARQSLADLKSDWMTASSIANVEAMVGTLNLGLEPTKPLQNYTLRPRPDRWQSRYSGLLKAFEKLKGNIPLVSSNEADARELFDGE
jgi:hypothetical protein